jgi:hypothetical protein
MVQCNLDSQPFEIEDNDCLTEAEAVTGMCSSYQLQLNGSADAADAVSETLQSAGAMARHDAFLPAHQQLNSTTDIRQISCQVDSVNCVEPTTRCGSLYACCCKSPYSYTLFATDKKNRLQYNALDLRRCVTSHVPVVNH